MTEQSLVIVPDVDSVKNQLAKISQFQKIVKESLHEGHDYGKIPGTDKPTLLKPGAEKIISLWGARPEFEYIEKTENWDSNFFYYHVKCRIVHINTGKILSEGEGSCSSKESKYGFRWEFGTWNKQKKEYDAPQGSTEMRWFNKKGGGKYPKFKVPNDDIASQVNTIQKMADKRAMVAAALILGRLSDLFTQDLEDMAIERDEPVEEEPQESQQETKEREPGEDENLELDTYTKAPKVVQAKLKAIKNYFKVDDYALRQSLAKFMDEEIDDPVKWLGVKDNWEKFQTRLNAEEHGV